MKCGRDRKSVVRREYIIGTGGIVGEVFFWHWFVAADGLKSIRRERSKSLQTNNIPVVELAVSEAGYIIQK